MKRNYKLKPIKNIIESFVEQDSILMEFLILRFKKHGKMQLKKKSRLHQGDLC